MKPLRFAILGAGFWSRFQLAGWRELEGAQCVAVYNRTRSKAEALAAAFGIPAVYDDVELLLRAEQLDFVDIITDVDTHGQFVHLAARYGLAAICQKPLARSYAEAAGMLAACQAAGVPLLVHENFRWQESVRQVRRVLDESQIGQPFRARIDFISGFPVFDNQPFLRSLEQFILTDVGSHVLDVARFLFGEPRSLYCTTRRIHADIRGEDVATVTLENEYTTVQCQMAYAENYLEHESFPAMRMFVEGRRGTLELAADHWLRVTTASGTHARRYPPPRYTWADPAYAIVHASIVPCNANLLAALRGQAAAETTGEDNLRTVRLVFAAYESAATGRVIALE
jgi:predicted dehydrogenase